ncbi:ATP-binding protein [Streptomyces sp. H39-S7]|uniref:ATP-binding protein n=1 Tax=Streptomyces sp. H39-S7 TaxID=3004357 RepID=UPI0022B04CD1|nr:ATP-binding protein [Streptomyces sp. H39-S7]MCZ4125488.1 ATP-binding protein [Streptomyces sp. H39-S7]
MNVKDEADDVWDYSLQIPHDLRGAGIARCTLRAVLKAYGLAPMIDVAQLVATELVANALEHSRGPVSLRLHWRQRKLRLGVWDSSPEKPEFLTVTNEAEGGRGMWLITGLAAAWGFHLIGEEPFGLTGKLVWADIAPEPVGG